MTVAVEDGRTVKVAILGKLEDGSVAMHSPRNNPLEFEYGKAALIRGFGDALRGMKPGERKKVTLSPQRAFGEYDKTKRVFVKKRYLTKGVEYAVGEQVSLLSPGAGGRMISGWIEKFDKDEVVINRNHRLAGKKLILEIEVLDVR